MRSIVFILLFLISFVSHAQRLETDDNRAGFEKGVEYEYRAVVEHPQMTITGEIKRVKVPN